MEDSNDHLPIRRVPSIRQSRSSVFENSPESKKRTADVISDPAPSELLAQDSTIRREKIARVPHESEAAVSEKSDTKKQVPIPKFTPTEMKAYLASLDLTEQGKLFEQHRIDSDLGQNLTREDFLDMGINSLGDRKKILSACENIKHPLFKVFMDCDADRSYKIDACELSHMLSRVEGKPFPEAQARAMIAEADSNNDGELDFFEFKEMMEKTNTSENWHAAQHELTMGTRFLHAGDKVLSTMHEAVRAGTFPSTAAPRGAPVRRIPSLLYRFVAFVCGNIFGVAFLGILTLGMFFVWATTHVNCRGQQIHQYFFGLKTVGYKTGRVVSWFTTVILLNLTLVLPILVGFLVGDRYESLSSLSFGESFNVSTTFDFAMVLNFLRSYEWAEAVISLLGDIFQFATPYLPGSVCNLLVIPTCVLINVLTGVMDAEGRLLTDKLLGVVIVFN